VSPEYSVAARLPSISPLGQRQPVHHVTGDRLLCEVEQPAIRKAGELPQEPPLSCDSRTSAFRVTRYVVSFPVLGSKLTNFVTICFQGSSDHRFDRVISPESSQLIPPEILTMLRFMLTVSHLFRFVTYIEFPRCLALWQTLPEMLHYTWLSGRLRPRSQAFATRRYKNGSYNDRINLSPAHI
jgi:hypothetical protein